jgi:hypothetical protein
MVSQKTLTSVINVNAKLVKPIIEDAKDMGSRTAILP